MGRKWELAKDAWAAFENLVRVAATPPEKRADELAAEEFCAKMRAMGANPTQGLHHAAMITALGASDEQMDVLFKVLAQGRLTAEDAHQLRWRGIKVDAEAQA